MTRRRSQAISIMTRTIYGGLSPGHHELAYSHTKRNNNAARLFAISRSMRRSPRELNLSRQGAIRWGRFHGLPVTIRPYTAKGSGADSSQGFIRSSDKLVHPMLALACNGIATCHSCYGVPTATTSESLGQSPAPCDLGTPGLGS